MPESDFESRVLALVRRVKADHACWERPELLAQELGLRLHFAPLGGAREGTSFDDEIVIDPLRGTPERRRFTSYHEITHQLIRRDDELYAALDSQYREDADIIRMRERLSDVGAAEFIFPRERVSDIARAHGYRLTCIDELTAIGGGSLTAACVQLARSAPHRCVAVVCMPGYLGGSSREDARQRGLWQSLSTDSRLVVTLAMPSPSMKYTVARGTPIASDHLLFDTFSADVDAVISGSAPIPFRSGRPWSMTCEAVRRGSQIFSLFHADDPPPRWSPSQLTLFC